MIDRISYELEKLQSDVWYKLTGRRDCVYLPWDEMEELAEEEEEEEEEGGL